MKLSKIPFIHVLFLSLLLSSCVKEDAVADIINGGETFTSNSITATIDGEAFSAAEEDILGEIEASIVTNSVTSTLTMAGLQASFGPGGSRTIVLVLVSDQDIFALPLNTTFVYQEDSEGNLILPVASGGLNISYSDEEIESVDANAEAHSPIDIVMVFTELDAENNTISGTFAFTATNPDTGVDYEVTNGVFTEIALD